RPRGTVRCGRSCDRLPFRSAPVASRCERRAGRAWRAARDGAGDGSARALFLRPYRLADRAVARDRHRGTADRGGCKAVYGEAFLVRRTGRANGSRECAPDDRLRETHRSRPLGMMDIASLHLSYTPAFPHWADGDRTDAPQTAAHFYPNPVSTPAR